MIDVKSLGKYLKHIEERYSQYCTWDNKLVASYSIGRKYVKVVTKNTFSSQKTVHSFIVLKDTNKFKAGDILMAASWAAPATNFARGNILDENLSRVRWTGVI